VGTRAVLDAVVKREISIPRRYSNPRTPIIQSIVSSLYRLRNHSSSGHSGEEKNSKPLPGFEAPITQRYKRGYYRTTRGEIVSYRKIWFLDYLMTLFQLHNLYSIE
jgi:hypothetical protein